ncbi:hypothetical protein Droror1_Dr00017850 [Drosera rotundifolia]
MASSFGVPTTASGNPGVVEANASVSSMPRRNLSVSFPVSPRPRVRLLSKGIHTVSNCRLAVKAVSNKAVDGSANNAAPSLDNDVASVPEIKNDKPTSEASAVLASQETVSALISQVSSLVKLVDSRDIVELQLKQFDCEITIRKKEAISPLPSPIPIASTPTVTYHTAPPPPPPASAPASHAPASAASSAPPPVAVVAQPSKSSLPPFKCPMSGTFYRSPAPGEPPFVKVGDKVKKGQVLCIVEAMKLMNEIEADQSGTIVEILAEDGKPIGINQPLFIIQP